MYQKTMYKFQQQLAPCKTSEKDLSKKPPKKLKISQSVSKSCAKKDYMVRIIIILFIHVKFDLV